MSWRLSRHEQTTRADACHLAETVARRLKIGAGLAGVAAWAAEADALTDDERTEGEAWARRVLSRGADAGRASAWCRSGRFRA